MQLHPGLKKYFSSLSRAAKIVNERKVGREKLRGYLHKIKVVSAQTAKKSVISSEIQRLEKHIAEMLDKKLGRSGIEKERVMVKKLKEKEEELNEKIFKLNNLLAKVGKRVDAEELKESLEETDILPELEDKLYVLETKYLELKENENVPEYMLDSLNEKISLLKEKIRDLKLR